MELVEEASCLFGNFILRLLVQLHYRLNHSNSGPDYRRFSRELDKSKLPCHVQYPFLGHR